jgi:hypothetical protein
MTSGKRAVSLALSAFAALASPALACDGQSYKLPVSPGEIAAGGGLAVRLDKAKLHDEELDKYWVSVKDEGQVLAEHVLLVQHDSIRLKTRCGEVSIGADRKSIMSGSTLLVSWSYF